jgi:hypothetical protein
MRIPSGVNRIDEGGVGDDVSSWQGYDPSFYPRYHWSDWLIPAVPPTLAALLLTFGVAAFLARRRRARSAGR